MLRAFHDEEATLVPATVARRYTLELLPDRPVAPDPTFTPRPKDGVKVVLRRRVTWPTIEWGSAPRTPS